VGTVLGGLLLPQFQPFDLGRTTNQAINAAGGMVQTQTSLLALQDAQRQQEAQALARQYMQQNPGSILGGGGPMGSAPARQGGGPMTQQTFGPGGVGPTQPVPGGQDLSRFAAVSPQGGGPLPAGVGMPTVTPPAGGPVLAGGRQAHPLEALMRQNPDAARIVQQQQQAQEDMQLKRQEQRLIMGEKVMEYLGRSAQGVTDQAGLDRLRTELQQQGLGQYAAQLPQVYSKEAMQAVAAKALSVKDSLTLQTQDLAAQAALIKARREGRSTEVDNHLIAMGVRPGQETPQQMREALQAVEDAKVRVSASHGTGQIVKGPTGEYIRVKPGTNQVEVIKGPGGEPLREKPSETEQKGATLANSVAAANKLATELEEKGYRPSVWEKGLDKLPLGLGNYLTSSDYQKYRQTVREFASAWLYGVSGAQITDSEWENANQTFFPQPNEDKGAVELKRQRRAALVTQLEQQTAGTGRTGSQAQPASGGATTGGTGGQGQQVPSGGQTSQAPTGAKVVSRTELHAEAQRRKISPAQAEQMAISKGYTVQ
jgi:hypothetical protein